MRPIREWVQLVIVLGGAIAASQLPSPSWTKETIAKQGEAAPATVITMEDVKGIQQGDLISLRDESAPDGSPIILIAGKQTNTGDDLVNARMSSEIAVWCRPHGFSCGYLQGNASAIFHPGQPGYSEACVSFVKQVSYFKDEVVDALAP